MPAGSGDMDDLKQHTTLQYCLTDNCTIMRIDTGQQLDIVYTTQSLLVVTPTNGQASPMLIPKNIPEQFCSTSNFTFTSYPTALLVIDIILFIFISIVSGYIAVIHLLFKKLRNAFGKLMMLYNIAQVFCSITVLVLTVSTHIIPVHSRISCYLFWFSFMQLVMMSEGFTTCILAYLAYTMHSSYKSKEMTKRITKKFYKYSIRCVLGTLLLCAIFMISYDFGAGEYTKVILPDGHCSFIAESGYDTAQVPYAYMFVNQIIQIVCLIVFFVYHYKVNNIIKLIRDMEKLKTQENRLFFRIALTMGATAGISEFIYIINGLFTDIAIVWTLGSICLLVQQFIIMFFIMTSKKTSQLCKGKSALPFKC